MRLIDADAFAEFLKNAVKRQKYEGTKIDGLLTVADVLEAVIAELDGTSLNGFKNAPTIPEIIHCKDCKYCDRGIDEDGSPFLKCLGWAYGGTQEDDFCSHAERRENDKR